MSWLERFRSYRGTDTVDTVDTAQRQQSCVSRVSSVTKSITENEPRPVSWSADDWRLYYLERAAIREYDGHLSREEADRRAWRETANRWWHEHGSRSAQGVCCGCGKPVSIKDAIPLPHDQRVHDADCMAAFGRKWLKEAAEALARFGIPAPHGYEP
jgi:hypothetical protein